MRRARLAGTVGSLLAAAAARAEEVPSVARIRAARDAVFARPEFHYRVAESEDSLLERFFKWWQRMLADFQQQYPVLFVIGLCLAGIVLFALLAHLLWTWRVARRAAFAGDDPSDLEAAIRRLDPGPHRALALAHAAAGRFDAAVRDLYTALLLTLDRRGALRYAGHKALLDYRIEAAGDPAARAALDRFADAYPPGSFGRRPPDAARFRELVATLDALSAPEAVPA